MDSAREHNSLIDVVAGLVTDSGDAWLVGGGVRDMVMGRLVTDIDMAVSRDPGGFAGTVADALGGSAFVMDAGRDVHRVAAGGWQLDITKLKGGIHADLAARDFTINAMALPLAGTYGGVDMSQVIDPHGGVADIRAGVIRLVSDGAITADPLRVLRAFRFAAQLGFKVEPATLETITEHAQLVARVSAERVRDELYVILSCADSAASFHAMSDAGVLGVVLPEVKEMAGVEQSEPHVHDLLGHSLGAMAHAERIIRYAQVWAGGKGPEIAGFLDAQVDGGLPMRALVKLAALLHDTGKPSCMKLEGGRIRFIGHDDAGMEINREIAARLRMSARAADALSLVAGLHMRPLQMTKHTYTKRAVHRLVREAGEYLPALMVVALADAYATREKPGASVSDVEGVVREVLEYGYGAYRKAKAEPLVTGTELMAALGIGPGPLVGELLREVEERRAEGAVRDIAGALDCAREVMAGRDEKK